MFKRKSLSYELIVVLLVVICLSEAITQTQRRQTQVPETAMTTVQRQAIFENRVTTQQRINR